MQRLTEHNPIVIFLYYFCVLLPVLFSVDPVLSLTASVTGFLVLSVTAGFRENRKLLLLLFLPVLGAVLNPLYNHSGATPLFFLNDNPVTLESLAYGFSTGLMIFAVLLWFRSFSGVMTSDRLLYLFGALSPKLSLILSMTLRYIPLYRKQVQKTRDAQRVLGLGGDEDLYSRLRAGMRVFSVMVTWALENGVTTADSMTARGYGVGRRSFFALFRWRKGDTVLLIVCLLLTGGLFAGIGLGLLSWTWFPGIAGPEWSLGPVLCYVFYAALCVLPVILEKGEERKWKKYLSEI